MYDTFDFSVKVFNNTAIMAQNGDQHLDQQKA